MKSLYLLGSRPLTHLTFWVIYYVSFSLIWANDGDYYSSFYLEFVLLPVRIGAVYLTIYYLVPKFLQPQKYLGFGASFIAMLVAAGFLQRAFLFLFYENFMASASNQFLDPSQLVRSMVLINSTVLFVTAVKIVQLWQQERELSQQLMSKVEGHSKVIEIKSDKRFFRISTDDILFIEGLGNYVIYHTTDQKLISYTTLKDALAQLPPNFIRIHKSYVINREQIKSYDPESVEINQTMIPVGKSFKGAI